MFHEKIKLNVAGSQDYAVMYTYFQNQSPELPIEKRSTVIVCPGGGYGMTSDREAEPVALGFMAAGFNTMIVRYSVAPARFPTALLELATAVKYVREEGVQYGCDPERVFMIGFSAGSHLVGSYGNFWSEPFVAEAMGCDTELLRPNGQILSYPVITSGPFAHEGSFRNLLGDRYDAEKEKHALEKTVNDNTPPTFLWHTQTDNAVPVENSLLMISALQAKKIKTEFHMFPEGVHGISLANELTARAPEHIVPQAAKWLELAIGFVKGF